VKQRGVEWDSWVVLDINAPMKIGWMKSGRMLLKGIVVPLGHVDIVKSSTLDYLDVFSSASVMAGFRSRRGDEGSVV
jgi:hypothetical protein